MAADLAYGPRIFVRISVFTAMGLQMTRATTRLQMTRASMRSLRVKIWTRTRSI